MTEWSKLRTVEVEVAYKYAPDTGSRLTSERAAQRRQERFRAWLRGIRAAAWDEAIQDAYDRGHIGPFDYEDSTNPYREGA